MPSPPREPEQRFVRLAAETRRHREQVGRVVAEAREALADFADEEPARRELRGVGGIVHDFYTGLEHLFERVAVELDGGVPAGSAWHRDLLLAMILDLPGIRPPVLQTETARALEEFLHFRHLFRNLYGFELEWPRLGALLERLPAAWAAVEADLGRFLAFLEEAASSG